MHVLVTGSNGALGRAVVSELQRTGMRVIAACRRPSPGADAVWDLAQQAAPQFTASSSALTPSVVVHCAARTGHLGQALSDGPALFDANVTGTLRVVAWSVAHQVQHLVYISGAVIYGEWEEQPKTETDALAPWRAGPYAASKWLGELAAQPLAEAGGRITILRLSSLYGPDYTRGLLPRWIEQARTTGTIELTPPTDDAFDLLHVRDAARTVRAAVEQSIPGIWNLGGGKLATLAELAELCARPFGARIHLQSVPPSRPRRILNWVDDSSARLVLRHSNTISLEQGVSELARKART